MLKVWISSISNTFLLIPFIAHFQRPQDIAILIEGIKFTIELRALWSETNPKSFPSYENILVRDRRWSLNGWMRTSHRVMGAFLLRTRQKLKLLQRIEIFNWVASPKKVPNVIEILSKNQRDSYFNLQDTRMLTSTW